MTAYTEQAIREALDGHFYSIQCDVSTKVIDKLCKDTDARHPPLPWTDADLLQLWQLKRKGFTIEKIEEKTGRERRTIWNVWNKRNEWKDRVVTATATAPKTMPLEDIRRAVCSFFMVGRADFMSSSRARKHCDARQVFCWFARNFTTKSYVQIGQYVGGRDHSTILHANEKVRQNFGDYRQAIEIICFDLGLDLKAKIGGKA